jgi:hypothetical protein
VRGIRCSARIRNMNLAGAPKVGRSYMLERLEIRTESLYTLNGNLRVSFNYRVGLFCLCYNKTHSLQNTKATLCSTIGPNIAYKHFVLLTKTLNSRNLSIVRLYAYINKEMLFISFSSLS